jgi:hypothetical protein
MADAAVLLYWLPLGAGGTGFVRLNGRIYEAITAARTHRDRRALLHTALEVQVPEGWFVIEAMWPSPDSDLASRGVTVSGPVFASWMPTRVFRYEVRCWGDGTLADREYAVGGPTFLSDPYAVAASILDSVRSVPALTWGRDQSRVGGMWNSNSVISWLLTRAGYPMETLVPPDGTRAPGWDAGVAIASRGT